MLALETGGELTISRIGGLTASQLALGAPTPFGLHVVGTVLPIMVFLWAYQAIAPHVVVDTTNFVRIFGLR